MSEYYGKYRGKVTNNVDSANLGRLEVQVPSVIGDMQKVWAMPSVPFAGPNVGLWATPPLGANVWIEFEAGNPQFPIWSGCFWGTDEMPAIQNESSAFLKTANAEIQWKDANMGEIIIKTNNGTIVKLASQTVEITVTGGGSIKIAAQTVRLNDGALEVI